MIDENRKKHIFGVAEKCRLLAVWLQDERCNPDEMYLMGFLHDIGYILPDGAANHAETGAIFLDRQASGYLSGYKYSYAIQQHGSPDAYLIDPVVWILQEADMTTDYDGKEVTYLDRMRHIEERHGKDSEAYKRALLVVWSLQSFTLWKEQIIRNIAKEKGLSETDVNFSIALAKAMRMRRVTP